MTTKLANLPDWIYRQSAVLPYRREADDVQVLLVTSRKGKRWVLPKGIVEPGLTAAESAAKEAREEAGVQGTVTKDSLGKYRYKKWGGTCRVEVYPMEVTGEVNDWPESETRKRNGCPSPTRQNACRQEGSEKDPEAAPGRAQFGRHRRGAGTGEEDPAPRPGRAQAAQAHLSVPAREIELEGRRPGGFRPPARAPRHAGQRDHARLSALGGCRAAAGAVLVRGAHAPDARRGPRVHGRQTSTSSSTGACTCWGRKA